MFAGVFCGVLRIQVSFIQGCDALLESDKSVRTTYGAVGAASALALRIGADMVKMYYSRILRGVFVRTEFLLVFLCDKRRYVME